MNEKNNKSNYLICLLFTSKLLFIVFLFCFQNSYAQLIISNEATIYSEKESVVYQSDSISYNNQENSRAEIYVSSEDLVFNLEALSNYRIVESFQLEDTKIEKKQQSISSFDNKQSKKKVNHNIASPTKETISKNKIVFNSKTNVYFSFAGGISAIFLPVSNKDTKYLVPLKEYTTNLSIVGNKIVLDFFKNTELRISQSKFAFSVRPPPLYFVS